MSKSGSVIHDNPDDFQASLPGAFDLVVERRGEFRARLTSVSLPVLKMVRAQEGSARMA